MTLRLVVDAPRWRAHLSAYGEREPNVVPVIKGNGYGFGFERLLVEPAPGHWPEVAVGTYAEAVAALGLTGARIVVLEPWRPTNPSAAVASGSERLVHTLSRIEDVTAFAATGSRTGRPVEVSLEVLTAVRRHGIPVDELGTAADALRAAGPSIVGTALALHHPLAQAGGPDPVGETVTAVVAAQEAGLSVQTIYVSHLGAGELTTVRAAVAPIAVRPRVGTALWLGEPDSYEARGTVLDVHQVERGDRYGYRQRMAPADGHLVVVGGGTSHGVALAAPPAPRGLRSRARTFALAGLSSAGLTLSPFTWAGRKRWFAEPPHMLVSVLFLPASAVPPLVGDELPVEVRMTTTHFDTITLGNPLDPFLG